MKRLILLTLVLTPLALHALRSGHHHRPGHHIGPRSAHWQQVEFREDAKNDERVVANLPKATPQRARDEAYRVYRKAVSQWLAPEGVPATWTPPEELLERAVRADPIEVSEREYGTVYIQTLRWNATPELREQLIVAYERELAARRLLTLGGVLGFVLVCLGALAGYIRADEATKGYYTNRLRLVAAAGVGAAGVALYRFLA